MNVNSYLHKYMKYLLKPEMIGIDMTMGGGNDALFLAERIFKVYAFDIQKEAIEMTKKRLKDHDNVIYILDGHQKVDQYVQEMVDVIFFNLGFLPKSDHSIITTPSNTIKAIKNGYQLLHRGGYMAITFYIGHKGGLFEYHEVMKFIKQEHYPVIECYKERKAALEPLLIIIKKP